VKEAKIINVVRNISIELTAGLFFLRSALDYVLTKTRDPLIFDVNHNNIEEANKPTSVTDGKSEEGK